MKTMAVVPPTVKQVSLSQVRASVLDDITVLINLHIFQVSDETLAGGINPHGIVLK